MSGMVADGARRTAPDGIVSGGEEEGVVRGPILERIDGASDVDVLCEDALPSVPLI